MVWCCWSRPSPTDQLDRSLAYLAGNEEGANPIGKKEKYAAKRAQKHPFSNQTSAVCSGFLYSAIGALGAFLMKQLSSRADRSALMGMTVDEVCIPCSRNIYVLKEKLLGGSWLFNQTQSISACRNPNLEALSECRLVNFLTDPIETVSEYPFAFAALCALVAGCVAARQLQGAVDEEAKAEEAVHSRLKGKYMKLAERLTQLSDFPTSAQQAKDLAVKISNRENEIKEDLRKLRIPSHIHHERVAEIVRPLFMAARKIQMKGFSDRPLSGQLNEIDPQSREGED